MRRYRGDTKPELLAVKQNGAAIDITDCTFVMSFSRLHDPSEGDVELAIAGAVKSATDGLVEFPFPSNELIGVYFYDVQMTTPEGYIVTIKTGRMDFLPDISR